MFDIKLSYFNSYYLLGSYGVLKRIQLLKSRIASLVKITLNLHTSNWRWNEKKIFSLGTTYKLNEQYWPRCRLPHSKQSMTVISGIFIISRDRQTICGWFQLRWKIHQRRFRLIRRENSSISREEQWNKFILFTDRWSSYFLWAGTIPSLSHISLIAIFAIKYHK